MKELQSYKFSKKPSERNFAFTFSAIFILAALYFGFYTNPLFFALAVPGVVIFFIGILCPAWMAVPNKIWFNFGLLLHKIFSPLFVGVVYCLAIIPTGLFLRIFRKDVLNLRFDKEARTYWTNRPKTLSSMKNQF